MFLRDRPGAIAWGVTLATQSVWALPKPQGPGVSSSGVRKTGMEAGWRQRQHGLARATGIPAPVQRCSSWVLGTAHTPGSSWQARVPHKPHCPGRILDLGYSFLLPTPTFPLRGITSSRKPALTNSSPSSSPSLP